jgi:hypothetical protein
MLYNKMAVRDKSCRRINDERRSCTLGGEVVKPRGRKPVTLNFDN